MKNVIMAALALLTLASAQNFPTLPLDHEAAPFVMTYDYARSVGATAEWRKMEGVAVDNANMKLYIAISDVSRGMSDGEGDLQLEENRCGAVYVADLDANYEISELRELVAGGPYDEDGGANRCAIDNISNPDNITVDGMGRVWIGEDTSKHENNALWRFDPETEELKRFAVTPLGAEVTGLHIAENGTLFMNIQHPSATNVYPYNRGTVGVVTGFNANTDNFFELPFVEGADKKMAHVAAGEYQILGRAGEFIPNDMRGQTFGAVYNVSGDYMSTCNNPDGNMFLPTAEDGSQGYLFSNFECRPGGMSKIYISHNGDSWDVIEGNMVDFADVNGTWVNCFASVTPWNTGLSGEEYPPETAEAWEGSRAADMSAYLGRPANPYDYGYPIEIAPGRGIGTDVTKHYAMGRFSVENAIVMADSKTAYYGDDGSNRVLYRFVADEEGNLDAGTLYAAKVAQQDDGTLALEWIELGHGESDMVRDAIRSMDSQLSSN